MQRMKKLKLTDERFDGTPPSLLHKDHIDQLRASLKWTQTVYEYGGSGVMAERAYESIKIDKHVTPASLTWKDGDL
jgi:hypothetical protein